MARYYGKDPVPANDVYKNLKKIEDLKNTKTTASPTTSSVSPTRGILGATNYDTNTQKLVTPDINSNEIKNTMTNAAQNAVKSIKNSVSSMFGKQATTPAASAAPTTTTTTTSTSNSLYNYLEDPVYKSRKNLIDTSYNSAINNANTAFDTGKSQLERAYGTSVDELNRNKKTSEQSASVAREQLKKYLPTMIKAQGLGGLGVSETAALSVYNDYATNMAQISADYNANKTSLDNSYNDSLLSLYTNKNNAITNADLAKAQSLTDLDVYLSEKAEANKNTEEAKNAAEKADNYNLAMTVIESGSFSDVSQLENYLKTFEGKVSDTQYNNLMHYVDTYKADDEKNNEEKEKEDYYSIKQNNVGGADNDEGSIGYSDFSDGDTFTVKDVDDGKEYELDSAGIANVEGLTYEARNVPIDTVFGYAGKLYYKAKDSNIYALKSSGENDDYAHIYNKFYGTK